MDAPRILARRQGRHRRTALWRSSSSSSSRISHLAPLTPLCMLACHSCMFHLLKPKNVFWILIIFSFQVLEIHYFCKRLSIYFVWFRLVVLWHLFKWSLTGFSLWLLTGILVSIRLNFNFALAQFGQKYVIIGPILRLNGVWWVLVVVRIGM